MLDFLASFRTVEIAMIVAALLTMGAATAVVHQTRLTTAEAETARTTEQSTIAQIRQRLRDLEQSGQTQGQTRASLAAAIDEAAAPGPARSALTAIERNIGSSARLAGGRRTGLNATYDLLYRSLGLTPKQIEKFESIRVQGAGPALWVFDEPAAPDEIASLSVAEMNRQLRALLGDDGYARYQEYNRVVPARNLVMQVASAVYLTDPLDREQGEQLTKVLAESSRAYQAGASIDLADLDWDAVLASARPILSPAQATALSTVRQRTAFNDALQRHLAQRAATADFRP